MTLLCPLKAALNNAVDPSLKDNRERSQGPSTVPRGPPHQVERTRGQMATPSIINVDGSFYVLCWY